MTQQQLGEMERAVWDAYSRIATRPDLEHPFPVGRELALSLGYEARVLNRLPEMAVEAFSGVSNVSPRAPLEPDDLVLDLGCGGGLDSLIAAERSARVVGVDFSQAMLERARLAVEQAGKSKKIELVEGRADRIPLETGTVDCVMVNGIFNLNPGRAAIMSEIDRVLRPGGRLFAAEIVRRETAPAVAQTLENWVA